MNPRCLRPAAVAVVAVLLAPTLLAKERSGPLAGLEYRLVGPFVGGRVSRALGVAGDPRTYYAAAASGGVWKSSDGGHEWKPIFDEQIDSSIGSIAVAPSDPGVVYVGAGESNIRGNVAAGHGIYKSSDAGKTWEHVWRQEGQIGTIAVHPRNADVAFAAVLGRAFGSNPQRGVYRTRDGGRTWQQVLKKDVDTGASDVAIDPSNPSVVFAGLWQARRRPWELTSGGPGSGLWVSRDGGDTWTELKAGEKGLPEAPWGKVGVVVAPSRSSRVYAVIEAEKGGVYRSDDGGESWSLASDHRALRQRAWYYSTLTVNPANENEVWAPQVPMLRSLDGGRSWKRVKGIHHGDHHDAWFDPADPRRMITANDGGVDITLDGGESWFAPRLPIGQCYHVQVDDSVPYRVSCALQDLGTTSGPSNSLSVDGINHGDWHEVGGGEAGWTAHDPSDPNLVYAGEYLGYISRYDHRTRQARHVGAWPDNQSGHGAEDSRYRFQWTAPIVISPHDPKLVYHGANVLFLSDDGGQSWTAISGDLTRNDRSKQKWSGGPITGDNTGVEHYGTIFSVAESPLEKGVIWAGSDDGLVHVSRDGGRSWANVTPAISGLPEWGSVKGLEASPHHAGTAYVVVDAHRLDDAKPYLWKTADYGRSWKSLSGGLAPDVYLHAVREDPKRKGTLYLGTERGVMFSRSDGASWESLQLNLPSVAVHDLMVKGDDLVLGTHGRSIWILDDLAAVRELSPQIQAKALHLFAPPAVTQWRWRGSFHEKGPGENPKPGLALQYWIRDKSDEELRLEVLDPAGQLVRTLSSKVEKPEVPPDDPDSWGPEKKAPLNTGQGVQRGAWDLAAEAPRKITKARIDWGDVESGPFVLPGRYTLKLSLGQETTTAAVELTADPRVGLSLDERREQLAFVDQVGALISRLSTTVEELRSLRSQLQARSERLKDRAAAKDWVKSAGELAARLDALEEKLHNPKARITYDILAMKGGARLYSQIIPLYTFARDADGVPTQGMRELFAERSRELEGYAGEWSGLVAAASALNSQARELGLDYLTLPGR
jgi:photosystem II stability/assembly factor-like uncharacterized protein